MGRAPAKLTTNSTKTKATRLPSPNPIDVCVHLSPQPPTKPHLEPLNSVQVPNEDVAVDQAEVREQRAERGRHEVALGDRREVAEPLLCFMCDWGFVVLLS